MGNAKIEIKIGGLHFSCEAEQQWVTTQLDKIIAKADVLGKLGEKQEPPHDPKDSKGGATAKSGNVPTLAGFLTSKSASTNQNLKFLATAAWLQLKGKPLTTGEVTKALKDNHQNWFAHCINYL